jgi:hypothetical protein
MDFALTPWQLFAAFGLTLAALLVPVLLPLKGNKGKP